MDYDEILHTWRSQDETPFYGVNRDLLLVVVRQDYAKMRYELAWDLWVPPWIVWGVAGLFLMLYFVMFNTMTAIGKLTPVVWDYVGAGVAIATIAVSMGAFWLGHWRQAARDREFGDSLQEEIQQSLSRIDYQLLQYGRWKTSLLMSAPIWTLMILFFSVFVRVNDRPGGWFMAFFFAWSMLSIAGIGRYFKKRLVLHKRRLNQLLALMNASE